MNTRALIKWAVGSATAVVGVVTLFLVACYAQWQHMTNRYPHMRTVRNPYRGWMYE